MNEIHECKCPTNGISNQQKHAFSSMSSQRRCDYAKYRKASLTEGEKVVLSSLFIDAEKTCSSTSNTDLTRASWSSAKDTHETNDTNKRNTALTFSSSSSSSLTDEMLFSIPFTDGIDPTYTIETNPSLEFDKYHIECSSTKSHDHVESMIMLKDVDTKNLLIADSTTFTDSSEIPYLSHIVLSGENNDHRDDMTSNTEPRVVSPTPIDEIPPPSRSKSKEEAGKAEKRQEGETYDDILPKSALAYYPSLSFRPSLGSLMDESSGSQSTHESFSPMALASKEEEEALFSVDPEDDKSITPITDNGTKCQQSEDEFLTPVATNEKNKNDIHEEDKFSTPVAMLETNNQREFHKKDESFISIATSEMDSKIKDEESEANSDNLQKKLFRHGQTKNIETKRDTVLETIGYQHSGPQKRILKLEEDKFMSTSLHDEDNVNSIKVNYKKDNKQNATIPNTMNKMRDYLARPPLDKVQTKTMKKQENLSKPKIPLKRSKPRPLGMNKRTTTEVTPIHIPSPSSSIGHQNTPSPKTPLIFQRPTPMTNRSRIKTAGDASPSSTSSITSSNNTPNSERHAALWAAHDRGELSLYLNKKKEQIKCETKKSSTYSDLSVELEDEREPTNATMLSAKNKIQASVDELTIDDVFSTKYEEANKCQKICQQLPLPCQNDSVPHFDCWKILRDEYAQDYGFAAKDSETSTIVSNGSIDSPGNRDIRAADVVVSDELGEDTELHDFKILGTGADDLSAQPHVLSPPLMDSLINFLPDSLKYENFWLKYSLVRDGANPETFLRYTRAATNSILAVQTLTGDVFGCFTTSPWDNQGNVFNGNGESFVWKMRYNRLNNKCRTLYDQAHLESEIDVYPHAGISDTIQLCTHSLLALGGTEDNHSSPLGFSYEQYQQFTFEMDSSKNKGKKKTEMGFALAIYDDLSRGTTSPCITFCSPSLLSEGGELFEVSNLELWTFTPCDIVLEAQKLEMRKFFITKNSSSSISKSTSFSSKDLIQDEFYRRLGEKSILNSRR